MSRDAWGFGIGCSTTPISADIDTNPIVESNIDIANLYMKQCSPGEWELQAVPQLPSVPDEEAFVRVNPEHRLIARYPLYF